MRLAGDFTIEDLTPPFYPRQFDVGGWRIKIPDLGQWLGRYIPGQPYADGYDHMALNDPLPFERWALGHDPKITNLEGLGEFAFQSFFQWREIPEVSPPKPFFVHMAAAFRESFGRIALAAVKVGFLVRQIKR